MKNGKAPIPGSERRPVGQRIADQPQDETIEVSVILKPAVRAGTPAPGSEFLSRETFAEDHGPDPKIVEDLRQFAAGYGLAVTDVSIPRRTVKLQGTVAEMALAFDVEQFGQYEVHGRRYRARCGAIHLPAGLAASVEAVLGLDDRPQARAHFRIRAGAKGVSFPPRKVAQLYDFPLNTDGKGQTIGIIELGGGYKPADLRKYFAGEKVREPKVVAVSVDKAANSPTNAGSADGEVLLDIEIAGSIAPGAQIVVYFAPNTSQGFQDALTTAIHDTKHKPSVISISWGDAESNWTAQAMTAFDSAAQDAAALGVTICAASGDNGSSDGVSDGQNHVDFPASSPHVLGCGGTTLRSAGRAIQSETVWNDGAGGGSTGGGFSKQFPLPSWQKQAGVSPPAGGGRGVPDVSGDADPQTGYTVLVDGQSLVIGGTSAVAPLWSGLVALLNQQLGKPLGLIQPRLYALPASDHAFHDIQQGSNGSFSAAPGWDPATGLGSPVGTALLRALSPAGKITS
jgi:kumamolisin